MNKIILDALVGAILLGGLSYFSSYYKDKSTATKIIAFLWSAPATYFYLLNIVSRQGSTSVNDFNNHALLGLIFTLFVLLFTMYFIKLDINDLITINFLYVLIMFFGYFYFQVYKLI